MVDWERVRRELADAGYAGFRVDTGETAVPGLSGAWVVGEIEREGRLAHGRLPLRFRLVDAIPGLTALPTDPRYVPGDVRRIAAEHGLDVVVIGGDGERVRVALRAPE
jgi:hypothetical protein